MVRVVLSYDGMSSRSSRKKRKSMSRSIASRLFSIRSASSMSSVLTDILESIFDCGELIFFFKAKGFEFSVLARGRRDATPCSFLLFVILAEKLKITKEITKD